MGLLDDAIREHLDLKRRRGADPTEVEREEREVLGPVRPRAEAAGHRDLAPEDDLEYEPIADASAPWDDLPAGPDSGAAAPPRPAFDHEESAPREREPFVDPRPEPAPQPGPAPAPYRAGSSSYEPPDPAGEHTMEFSVEDALEDERADEALEEHKPPGEEDEDVLEETPDFLQDTPDHDRLWFEQRPPRDFDFDG
jgi:hypothetical protein